MLMPGFAPAFRFACLALPLLAASPAPAATHPSTPLLVMISVDGMKPEYVTQAKQHGLTLPVLGRFLTHATYAEGVTGVVPTVTYPSHTTMVTGVWPAEHGIVDNTLFDPLREHPNQWYWDFSDIKVPTLYTAADAAGIKTANVGWPVTVGAPIDFNIAEGTQSEHTDRPPVIPYNPPDILEQLGFKAAGEFLTDAAKTADAVAILKKFRPGLLLVHLTELDHQEHEHSPFSAEADRVMEATDAEVGQIEQTALAVDPRARIVVVSDHGFLRVDHRTNLNVILARAGLIHLGPPKSGSKEPSVVAWQAEAWAAGGSNAIVLHDPQDAAPGRPRARCPGEREGGPREWHSNRAGRRGAAQARRLSYGLVPGRLQGRLRSWRGLQRTCRAGRTLHRHARLPAFAAGDAIGIHDRGQRDCAGQGSRCDRHAPDRAHAGAPAEGEPARCQDDAA